MTKVTLKTQAVTLPDQRDSRMFCLTVKGHAGAGPKGSDIVCAGVSVLVQALACQLSVMPEDEVFACTVDGTPGSGAVAITAVPAAKGLQQVSGMFRMALTGFHLLAGHYPAHVTLTHDWEQEQEEHHV